MKTIIAVAAFAALGMPWLAFAHQDNIDSSRTAVTNVLKKFKLEESEDLTDRFTAVKAWPEGGEIRVKVYLTAQNELLYACKWDHTGGADVLKCDKK